MSDNGPPADLKIIPDDAPVRSWHDTLSMDEAFAKVALPRQPLILEPTGFSKPRRRR